MWHCYIHQQTTYEGKSLSIKSLKTAEKNDMTAKRLSEKPESTPEIRLWHVVWYTLIDMDGYDEHHFDFEILFLRETL